MATKHKPDLVPLELPQAPNIQEASEVFDPLPQLYKPLPHSVTKLNQAYSEQHPQPRRMERAILNLKQIKKNFPRAYKALLTIVILVILGILAPLFLPVLGLPILPALGIA